MIKVAAYCRVSTDKDDQANSFESQKKYFRDLIQRNRQWELYRIYADEGITGTSTKKRIQFLQMIEDAKENNFRLILTKEVSRFSRNILDTILFTRQLKDLGIGVVFILDGINTLDPDAELRLSIMASLAQEESRKTSARVIWGQTRQMEKGVVFGHSMLGYDVKNGILTVNPEGAEIVRIIFHKYALEQVSTAQIARFLMQEEYHTFRGSKKWKPSTIVKILKNEKYAGDLIQRKSYTPDFLTHEKKRNAGQVPFITIQNHHEPIISREVWNLTQNRLRQNDKHTTRERGHSNRYIFSGKIKCGECGASFVGRYKYSKDGTRIRRWSCGTAIREGTSSCNVGKLVRDDDALQMLKTAISSLSIDTDAIIENVTDLAMEAIHAEEQDANCNFQKIESEIDRIQKKKEIMLDSYFAGEISRAEMYDLKKKYVDQLFSLQNRLEKLEECQKGIEEREALKRIISEDVRSILNGELESEVFYKTMLHSLTVFKDRHVELKLNYLPMVFCFIE